MKNVEVKNEECGRELRIILIMPYSERLEKMLFTLSERVRNTFFVPCKYFLTEVQSFIQFIPSKIQQLESEAESN